MPAEFQKAMDFNLIGLKNTFCFLDDILIVSKRSEVELKLYNLKCLKRLDDDSLRINLPKCHFSNMKLIGSSIIFHNQVSHLSRARPPLFCLSSSSKDIQETPFFSGLSTLYHQVYTKFSPN